MDIEKLKDEQIKLIKVNQDQKCEIEILKENADKARKEIQFQLNEKKKVEVHNEKMAQNYEELKAKTDKLHRITYGKFKK